MVDIVSAAVLFEVIRNYRNRLYMTKEGIDEKNTNPPANWLKLSDYID